MVSVRSLVVPGLLGLAVAVVLTAPAKAGQFSQIVSFGDSLTDTGNDFILFNTPRPPYYMGRFSNGPTWVEYLAGKLGVADPMPSVAGGTNYAYGGATAGTIFQGVPDVNTQIQTYLKKSPTADPNALYTVWVGANDFTDGQTDASIPAHAVNTALTSLINAGAKHIVVGNMPAEGATPLVQRQGPAAVAAINALDVQFNNNLVADLNSLRAANTGVVIDLFDAYSFLNAALQNPAAFGYTNTTDELIQNPFATNPDGYLFWDYEHPTTKGHSFVADQVFSQLVPEPGGMALASVCGLAVAVRALRRKRAGRD
jgi:phospholipase/lecithinase/hemolysin